MKKYNYIAIVILYCLYQTIFASNITTIPEVKLKPKRSDNHQSHTYISTTRFTKVEIEKSPTVNLSQFLKQNQSVVRLNNSSGDVSQTSLSIRGFGDNAAANSLILVDGFPLINPSLLAPNFNSIPLSDIDHMEIFQGSEGSLWGDQAVGGVVNLVTKHPAGFSINSITNLGSYANYYENFFIEDKLKNQIFYKIFGVIGKTDNYRNHNQQNTNNFLTQLGKDYSSGTLSVNLQSYGDTTYFPGGLTETQFYQNPRQATEFHNYSRYRTNVFQILNKQALNDSWTLETRFNQRNTNGDGFVYLNFNRDDSLTSFNPRLIGLINNNKIIIGYNGQLSRYELTNSKVKSNVSANQNDLYFQDILPVINKVDFIIGARKAWQNEQVGAGINPSVDTLNQVFVTEQGFIFHPNEKLSFFFRRDGNFSFPKADEAAWIPSNVKSLQVQTGTSYEAGAEWHTEKLISQINIYRLDLINEISFNPLQNANQPFGAYNNLDDTRRNGVSVSEQYQLFSAFKMNSQINLVDAKFASGPFSGNYIPAVPALNGNVGFIYNLTEKWSAQYNLLYTGSRYASEDLENIGNKLSSYWINDVSIQYFIKSLILSFQVQNLLNKQYVNYAYYDTYSHNNTYYPAAGRNYQLTLKLNIN